MPTLILCFHRVADPQNGGRSLLAISPEDFRRTLELVGARYRLVDLEEGARPSKEKKAVVTFDDGYADNLRTALPILQDMGIPATFFISTGFIGTQYLYPPDALDAYFSMESTPDASQMLQHLRGLGYWKALEKLAKTEEDAHWQLLGEVSTLVRKSVLEQDPLRRPMTEEELSELAGVPGVKIGPHTVTHRRLSSLSSEVSLGEVTQSISWLRAHSLDTAVFFAYPYGQKPDMAPSASSAMREQGYEPLTTLPVLVNRSSMFWLRRWGLPRLSVGPAETPLMSLLVRILPLASRVTPLWLMALAIRRRLFSSTS